MHKVIADPEQLRHELGHERPLDADDVLRIAKRQNGVRAKLIATTFDRLVRLPLPAMANGSEGWFVIGRATDNEALIQRPGNPVEKRTRDAFAEIWSGEVVLVTTRERVPANSAFINDEADEDPEQVDGDDPALADDDDGEQPIGGVSEDYSQAA